MKKYFFLALLVAAGAAWSQGWLQPTRWRAVVDQTVLKPEPKQMLRWKDERGHWAYGTEPPVGVHAERVRGEDRMSVVEAPVVKPSVPSLSTAASDVPDIHEKMMDRIIDGK